MININEGKCFLGDCIVAGNGTIEITVPKNVGPRIIAFNKTGGANILFQDENDEISKDVSAVYGEGKKWHIYGGHRLWLSPENEETYYPDNEPVTIKTTENSIAVFSAKWEKQQILPSMKIDFIGENSIRITHTVKNLGKERELCLWALTVLKAGGRMELPLETKDTGLLANRNIVLWPYNDINDQRFEIFNNKIVLKSSIKATKPFKVGVYKDEIKAQYIIGNNTFVKSFEGVNGEKYPDFCCNFESYTSNLIHELESISPMVKVAKNKIITHTEYWELQ